MMGVLDFIGGMGLIHMRFWVVTMGVGVVIVSLFPFALKIPQLSLRRPFSWRESGAFV